MADKEQGNTRGRERCYPQSAPPAVMWREIRVEPVLFVFSLAVFLYGNTSNLLYLQKTCFPDGPPGVDAICHDSEKIKQVASINSVRSTLRECLPAVTVLLAGSWRDSTGLSRPLILLGHAGELVCVLVDLLAYYQWGLSAWVTIAGDTVPSGLAGSRSLVTMACLAYISDTTSPQARSNRMAGVMVAVLGGVCISSAAGGYILGYLGYPGLFLLLLVMYLGNVGLTLLLVRDGERRAAGGIWDSVKNLRLIFRSRPNNGAIWVYLIFNCFVTSMLTSEGTVFFLFLQNMSIDVKEAGLLGAYKMIITLISAVVLTPLLKKVLKLSDIAVAVVCCIPSSISCFGMAFATTRIHVYIFVTLDLMRIVLISTLLSLVTRSVKKTEIGTYTSFLSAGDALMPLGFNPLYAYIFSQTLDSMPGAYSLVSGSVVALGAILIAGSSYFYKEDGEEEKADLGDAVSTNTVLTEPTS